MDPCRVSDFRCVALGIEYPNVLDAKSEIIFELPFNLAARSPGERISMAISGG
jgi:hypothetical protein